MFKRRRSASRFFKSAACSALIYVALAGCSAGSKVNLGSGQGGDPATVDFPIFYVKRTIPTASDDLRRRFEEVGTFARPSSVEETNAFIAAEQEKWRPIIHQIGTD